MKRVFFFIALALMLVSCASTRNIQEATTAVSVDSTSVQEATKQESEKVVDTTRTEHGKVVITEIIFDTTPPPAASPDTRASPGTTEKVKSETAPTQTPAPATVNIPGFGQVSGNIKSIRQTVFESDNETKGVSKESEKQEESKCNANVSVAEETNHRVEKTAPDPKRWRYIFYIVAIGIVALLYLKRVPILNWIKRILSGLRRIF